jgi:hypothetical protein
MKRAARVVAQIGRTMRPTPERVEQANGVQLLRSMGAAVYVLGTVRRKGDHPGTMQTPGIADVEAFLPAREGRPRRLLKWEAKSRRGRLRPEQAVYRELCSATPGVLHVTGPLDALIAALIEHGYLRGDQVGHYHLPAGGAR